MTEPESDIGIKVRRFVRPTQREWTIAIYAFGAFLLLAIVVVVLAHLASARVARSLTFGLGAGAFSALASVQIARGFRRAVGRPREPVMTELGGGGRPAEARLPGTGTHLRSVDLSGANLIGAQLAAADLVGARLSEANLSHASLDGALLSRARLIDAALQASSLNAADVEKADLTRADLSYARLRNANLRGARLEGAVLRGADLRDALLDRADLRRVDLAGADLGGARLQGTDCRGTAFQDGQLDKQQLRNAVTDDDLPEVRRAFVEAGKNARYEFGRKRQ